jgi:hypothetical protein
MSRVTKPTAESTDREALRRELLRLIVNNETHRRDIAPAPNSLARRIDSAHPPDTESK